MIGLLAKIFIKNSNDKKDKDVREQYGILCGIVGILLNIILFIFKFIAGTISGSIAITADAFNNLSDAGSSLITLIGFKLGNQKPDPEHPFGHGRMEYISGLVVSFLILLMAYELFKSSIDKILHPAIPEYSVIILVILIASIITKMYMAYYNYRIGKEIGSAAMSATARDSISDSIATIVVLIATIIGVNMGIAIDGYLGIIVSLFILFAGVGAVKDTVGPLLGQPPEQEFVDEIEKIVVDGHELVIGMHDLVVHDYGPGRVMISLHAEVPMDEDVMILHDEIDAIEIELAEKLKCEAVIHMDPICTDNEEIEALKEKTEEIIALVDAQLSFHDFRAMQFGTGWKIFFDVVAPFKFKLSDEQLVTAITEAIQAVNEKIHPIIRVDHSYTK